VIDFFNFTQANKSHYKINQIFVLSELMIILIGKCVKLVLAPYEEEKQGGYATFSRSEVIRIS